MVGVVVFKIFEVVGNIKDKIIGVFGIYFLLCWMRDYVGKFIF